MSIDIDYENPWLYDDKPFVSDDIGDYFGFFISLPISPTHDATLVESIFGRFGNQKERNAK